MPNPVLPICSYPTTTIVIDDDPAWNQALAREVETRSACITFQRPAEAIAFLTDHPHNTFAERCFEQNDSFYDDHSTQLTLDESKIHQEVYNDQRFSDISVVVVDYDMPGMDGVTLCQKIQHMDVAKILLTGEADETIAVNAFNSGLIDAYIKKSTQHVTRTTLDVITEWHRKVMLKRSLNMTTVLANKENDPLSRCFFDPDFATAFYALLKEHGFVEFYYVSSPANFLLVDAFGQHAWLVVHDEQEMDLMIDWAVDQHQQEPADEIQTLIEAFKRKEKVTFFYSDEDRERGYFEWGPCIHSCKPMTLPNGKTYYIALIQDNDHYQLHTHPILGFDPYLDSKLS